MTTRTENTKRTRGIVALGAGAALLLAGSSFALWHDESRADAGTLTAGQLAVEATAPTWQDVSDPDAPVDIDLADFRLSPGDHLVSEQEIDLALEGDNLYADALVELADVDLDDALIDYSDGVTLILRLLDADGSPLGERWLGMVGDDDIAFRVASEAFDAKDSEPLDDQDLYLVAGPDLDGVADAKVQLEVRFATGYEVNKQMRAGLDLGALQTTLTQVR